MNKNVLAVVGSVIVLHFLVTSLVGHYVAVEMGSEIGGVVAEGLARTTEASNAETREAPRNAYQMMRTESDDVVSRSQLTVLLLSLPVKHVIQPLVSQLRRSWIYDQVVDGKISKGQARRRMFMVDAVITAVNSLSLGVLVYLALGFLRWRNASST